MKLEKVALFDTTLENQILFMETLNEVITTPMVISIINSLKELKGIKHNQVEKLK